MKTLFTLILLLVFTTPALSDDTLRIEFGGFSYHIPAASKGVTNESHNILAADWLGYSAGKFDNSYGKETWFVAKTWRSPDVFGVKDLDAIGSLGVNRGYTECYGNNGDSAKFCPHGYVGFDYSVGRVYISVKTQVAVTLVNFGIKIF